MLDASGAGLVVDPSEVAGDAESTVDASAVDAWSPLQPEPRISRHASARAEGSAERRQRLGFIDRSSEGWGNVVVPTSGNIGAPAGRDNRSLVSADVTLV